MPDMNLVRSDVDDVTVLALSGRLVFNEGEAVLRDHIAALVAHGRTKVVLNVHEINYVDSSGIGALVDELKTLRRLGGDLKLVCPSRRCEHVLAMTHLLPMFELYESEDAAVRSFAHVRHALPAGTTTARQT